MADKFIGKRLDGRYEIHELVGVGGMAYVYRAYDRVEDRWVAIKILKEEFSNNSDFLRRFRNESRAIAMLDHPNTVKVYDVSFGDQIQYIVMEYIDGITLKQYIEQEGTIRWQEAVHFTAQILAALELAHSKGIIHRDIKPQNIMLLQNGTIKVADFGIARFLQSETTTMTDKAIGSVHYIAPEQARGDYITDKADIYSVGVMLYEMLTGRLPFVADNAVSVALMQLQAKPVMPRELNPSIPRGLEQITMKAMEKNPVDRFQSAGEMLDDLEQFRRNPNMVFRYDFQVSPSAYDSSRQMDAYDSNRFKPTYDDNYEYEEELVRSRKSAKGAMVVKGVIAALIIVFLSVGAVWLMNNWETLLQGEEEEQQIQMPKFEGMVYQDIITNSEYTENFTFKTIDGNDPNKQPGEVLKQSPKDGIMVKKGREVELTINGQVQKIKVPDLTNYAEADAVNSLKAYNLGYKVENVADDEIEVGKVISTDPPANTDVSEGTVITLRISKGPSKKKTRVPDGLKGDILQNVTAKLEDKNLTPGNVTQDDKSTEPAGTVLSVTPASGTEVSEGTVVDIVVSSGKGAVKTMSYAVPLPAGIDRDIDMRIYRNGTLIDSRTVNPAYSSTATFESSGTSGSDTFVIELDGQTYMTIEFNYDSQLVQPGQVQPYIPPSTGNEPSGGGDDPNSIPGSGNVTD